LLTAFAHAQSGSAAAMRVLRGLMIGLSTIERLGIGRFRHGEHAGARRPATFAGAAV